MLWANRLGQSIEEEHTIIKDTSNSEPEKSTLDPILTQNTDDGPMLPTEELHSLISFESTETPDHTKIIRQPSPPPVLAEVQDLIPAVSPQVPEVECGLETLSSDDLLRAESPLQLHIVRFMTISFVLTIFSLIFGLLAVFQDWKIGNFEYVRSF